MVLVQDELKKLKFIKKIKIKIIQYKKNQDKNLIRQHVFRGKEN
jgi:hypothetical protein